MARLVEEMKALVRDLPARVADRMSEVGEPFRKRRLRRFHPMMFDDILHMTGDPSDPVGILMGASLIRDDVPWLYEIAMEAYHAVKSGDSAAVDREISRIHRFAEVMMKGPFMEEFGMGGREAHMFCMEFPRMLERMLQRSLAEKKAEPRQLGPEVQPEQIQEQRTLVSSRGTKKGTKRGHR